MHVILEDGGILLLIYIGSHDGYDTNGKFR